MNNREIVNTKDEEGKDIVLAVLRPTPDQEFQAQLKFNAVFRIALENKNLLRLTLDKYMREQNMWDDEKQAKVDELINSINENETKLMKGGIKKSEAKALCITLRLLRRALQEMYSIRNSLDASTADALADNAKFDYLASQCIVWNDSGKPYCDGFDDYRKRGDEIAVLAAATKFASMYHGLDSDFMARLPENKILKQLGMVNDNLDLINDKGQLVDIAGRPIDEDGDLINENGQKIDTEGNLLLDDIADPVFLDDDVEVETEVKEKRKSKTKA